MKRSRFNWKTGVRLAVGLALLVWIFHAIFVLEGKAWWRETGALESGKALVAWDALPRGERWNIAWTHGPEEFWDKLRAVSPAGLTASLAFMGFTLLLGVIRWQLVLNVHGFKLSFRRALEISLVAQFFNSFLLGSTGGDVIKAYSVARETHHKKTEAVVTVLVDRLLGLFSILLFACLMMLPNLTLLLEHRRLAFLAALVVVMCVGCGVVLFLSLWGGLSRTVPQARAWLLKLPKGEELQRALDACRPFGRDGGLLLKTLALSMALNVCCVLQVLSLARGLDLTVDAMALFVVVPIVVCLSAVPISPSSLGLRENLYVWMLAVPGIKVPEVQALSLSLLAYAGFLAWSIVGGIVYVLRREKDHLAELVREENGV